jgi:hypothetical protein
MTFNTSGYTPFHLFLQIRGMNVCLCVEDSHFGLKEWGNESTDDLKKVSLLFYIFKHNKTKQNTTQTQTQF